MSESLTTLPSRSPIAIMPVWTRTLANELAAGFDGVVLQLVPEEPWLPGAGMPMLLRAMTSARWAALSGVVDWSGPMQTLSSDPIQVATLPPELSPAARAIGWTSTMHPTSGAVVRWDVMPASDPTQGAAVTIMALGSGWPAAPLLSARLILGSISWRLR